ncbi:Protein dcg1 [Lecanora helva]
MAPLKILIINPNTNHSMTDALRAPIDSLNYNNTTYTYHTSPHGPSSINTPHDAFLSTNATLPSLLPLLPHHDAFLIACYSPHPLIPALKQKTKNPVIGIFEASVWAAVQLLREEEEEVFGIVSTGDIWKEVLGSAVREDILGDDKAKRVFGGVECCGLDAGDLHGGGEVDVEGRVKEAARRLVDRTGREGRVGVVVLGCAGMVGMEEWVREVVGGEVRIVDGVRAGVGVLQGLWRMGG